VNRHKHPAPRASRRSTTPECRRGSEAGDTLLEVLIAIVVLALASVALIVGFGTSISSSAEHRNLATFDTVLASTSQEAISQIQQQQSLFQTCHSNPSSFYQSENNAGQPAATSLYMAVPSPYSSQYTVTYTGVLYWNVASGVYNTNCVVNGYQAELITITAKDNSTGVSYTNSFVVNFPSTASGASQSGTAFQLFFEVQPGPTTTPYTAAGIPLGFQPVIDVEDGSAIPVTTDLSPVTLTLAGGTPGATLTGCSGNEVLGVITFTGCTVSLPDTPSTPYTIIASDGSLPVGSQTATSNPFFVGASAPSLVFTSGTPTAGASGSAFTVQPQVTVEAGGVPDTSWTGTIALTASGGVLAGCSNLTISAADLGVANVTGCTFEGGYVYNPVSNVTEATVYSMTATATGVASGTSGAFSVTSAGTASQLVFSVQPTGVASTTPSTPFSGQPAVTVEDAFGNPVTSGYAPTISISSISVGTLGGCTSSNSEGITTFSGCYGSAYGNGITITASASSGGLSVVSAPFNITRAATVLVFTTQPVAGVSGTDFLTQPVLAEEDSLGNVVTSATAQVTLAASGNGKLTFCSGLTPVNGIVNVVSCNFAGTVGTTYTLTATATGLSSVTSSGFKVTSAGAAASLVFTTQPQAGVSQSPFTVQPVITVLDSGGNVVTSANVTVTLTPLGGTLASCTGLTAVAGVINVSNCTFAGVVGQNYTLTANANGLLPVTSSTFHPTGPGPASQIVLTGCSTGLISGTSCALAANIEDIYGNLETAYNSSVTFAQTSGTGSVTGLAAQTATGGVASDTITGLNWGLLGITASGDSVVSMPASVQVVGITSTSLASNANPGVVGQSVTYTATVALTSPGGGSPPGSDTVSFLDGGTPIVGCTAQALNASSPDTATCQVVYTSTGGSPHAITAIFSGDANFGTSTATALSETVNQAATSTVVSSSNNPAVTGQAVTYTGTVSVTSPGSGTPTGNVEFFDGGAAIAACGGSAGEPLNGSSSDVATCSVIYAATGSHTITAQYLGNSGTFNASSVSGSISEVINQGPTATAVISSANPSVVGQTVTYTATVTAASPSTGNPTGNVKFFDGGTAITGCTAQALTGTSTDTAICVFTYVNTAGSPHTITAQYLGNAGTYAASAVSASISQVVTVASTTTSMISSANPSVSGQSVTYTATVAAVSPGTGNPTGNVEFFDGVTGISGCTAKALPGTSTDSVTCVVSYANTVGSPHTITAEYLGNAGTYATSTSSVLSQVVNQAATSTSVATSLSPTVVGQSVTYTATVTVTSPGTGNATGSVEFFDGGIAISTCTSQSLTGTSTDTATCAVTYNASGSHTITAQYQGNPTTYAASAISSSISQTVNQASTSSSVASNHNPSVVGQAVTYTATITATSPGSGNPTGNVEFFDSGTAISGCAAQPASGTATDTATCIVTYASTTGSPRTITVQYLGNTGTYNASAVSTSLSQTVGLTTTTSVVATSGSPSVVGQTVTYTATIAAVSPGTGNPTGNVEFFDAGTPISACTAQAASGSSTDTATCLVTYLNTTGSVHTITAQYLGNATTYAASPVSASISQTVNQAGTTVSVASNHVPAVVGQQITYTATVTATSPGTGNPTGTIEFFDGGSAIAGCTAQSASGGSPDTATCLVTYANNTTHTITAQYLGSTGTYNASVVSGGLSQTVSQAATGTSVSSSINPAVVGQSTTYTATVTATSPGTGNPTGSVEFFDNGVAITGCAAQALSGTSTDTATCSSSYANTNANTITAQYLGNAGTYAASAPSTSISEVVNQAATSAIVVSNHNPASTYQQVTYTATVTATSPGTGNPTGSVKFFDGGTAIGTCTSQALTGTSTDTATCTVFYAAIAIGSHTITAQYLGNTGMYSASLVSGSIAETVNASSAYSGNSGVNLSSTAIYYAINASLAGSTTSTANTLTPGTATTLTSLTFTISATNTTTQTATVGTIVAGVWTATGLTCAITSGQTSCSIVLSTTSSVNPINIMVTGGGAITGTWTTTYTQP
jgi:type II secretory pathway pseudopilin PulG